MITSHPSMTTQTAAQVRRIPAWNLTVRVLAVAAVVTVLAAGCRGTVSEQPPIHPNQNMDSQPKYKAQAESRYFEDGSTMRMPVEHTVARGELRADDAFFRGKTADGVYTDLPFTPTDDDIVRGRERYRIFCEPCHGGLGNGRGKIMDYKYPIPPTSYFEPRLLAAKDGYLFEVISNGIRTMPAYKAQIPVRDRWLIVTHVRELQRAPLHDSLRHVLAPTAAPATASN